MLLPTKSNHPRAAHISGGFRSETDARPLLCFTPTLAFVDVYLSAFVIVSAGQHEQKLRYR